MPKLFLLHFAGGNCYSYRFLMPMLGGFDVITPELPGRGKRTNEALIHDFGKAAEDLYGQISASLDGDRFFIYGHSMGAYLALRVANLLEIAGNGPTGIVVSGNAGPGMVRKDKKFRHLMEKKELTGELRQMRGIPEELLSNDEVFSFFEPVLRADFEIAEKHGLDGEPAIKAPLYAIMGSQEENASEISNWSRFTTGNFYSEVLEGDHFFIHRHPQRIAGIINMLHHRVHALPQ
jgi:external thioesterase TEII